MSHKAGATKLATRKRIPLRQPIRGSAGNSALTTGVSQAGPNFTKIDRSAIPPPQSARIMQRYAAGQSIREISRAEGRARQTVTKVVKSEEMRTFVCALRERLYALGDHAVGAVEHALIRDKDGRLGYRLLLDIGAVPSPQERTVIPANIEVFKRENLNSFELEVAENERGEITRTGVGIARMIQKKSEAFGLELPTVEELRHNRMVAQAIDEAILGNGLELHNSNPAKWGEMKRLFEEKLREFKEQVQHKARTRSLTE